MAGMSCTMSSKPVASSLDMSMDTSDSRRLNLLLGFVSQILGCFSWVELQFSHPFKVHLGDLT